MKKPTVCIFPDTVPHDGVLFPLVQVFDRVVYCQAVENMEIDTMPLDAMASELIRRQLCILFAPAPLGTDRERFLALVADLRSRRDDYASQLGALSLAGLGQPLPGQKESGSSIIARLLRSSGIEDKSEQERELLLWQARLVLQLAEIFDEEQARLEQEMEKISALQEGLFAELREETGEEFALTRKLHAISSLTDSQLALRLKAWTRLLFLGSEPLPDPPHLFVTTGRDGLDRLEEQFEKLTGQAPQPLLRLSLPAQPAAEDIIGRRDDFREQARDLLAELTGLLADPAGSTPEEQARFADEGSPWAELLEALFPAATTGRRHLDLVHFPAISAGRLFMETFARDREALQAEVYDDRNASVLAGHLA